MFIFNNILTKYKLVIWIVILENRTRFLHKLGENTPTPLPQLVMLIYADRFLTLPFIVILRYHAIHKQTL